MIYIIVIRDKVTDERTSFQFKTAANRQAFIDDLLTSGADFDYATSEIKV